MIDDIIAQYAAQAVYTVACLGIGYLFRALRSGNQLFGLIAEGVCALLRDRLLHKLEKCESGGYCSIEARDDIEHMFHIYSALGGNGTIKTLKERVFLLPTEPPEGKEWQQR